MKKLPNEWKTATMRDICTVRQGLQIKINERHTEPAPNRLPYITIQHLNNPDRNPEYVENPKKSVICYEDDILMTRTGNTGIVVTGVHGVFHNNFFLINYDRNKVDHGFLCQYLNLKETQHEIMIRAGTSTIPDLNHGDFYNISLLLPPLEDQRKIGAILGTWDRAIGLVDRLIEALQARKKGLMQKLLTGEVRFAEFEGKWDEKPIGSILKEVHPRVDVQGTREYSLLSVRRRSEGAFFREKRTAAELNETMYEVRENDFVISKRQIVHGASALVTAEFEGFLVSNDYSILQPRNGNSIRFFNWLSKTPRLYQLSHISSHGIHIEKLFFVIDSYLKHLINIPPSNEEQEKIADVLDRGDREGRIYKHMLLQLRAQKRGLMQALLMGQVRV